MLEIGGELDLREEALGAQHRGELRVEHLDGHLAVVPDVLGEIHRGHAARAQLPLDPVAVGQRRGEAGRRPRHGATAFANASQRPRAFAMIRWYSGRPRSGAMNGQNLVMNSQA